jgi:CBS domain-containing protein
LEGDGWKMSEAAVSSVEDVFSRGVVSIREDDTLSKCLALFKEEKPPALVVVDSKGKYKGVLARRWVIRSRLDPSTTKVKTLMRTAPTVKPRDPLSKVARLMIETGIRQLPVYRRGKLQGFIKDEDVIHSAVLERWGGIRVGEIMTKPPFVVEEDSPIGSVINLFREEDISHAPVVSKGKLVGVIGVHDIIESTYKTRRSQTRGERIGEKIPVLSAPVKRIMSKPVVTVSPTDELRRAEKQMHKFNVSSLIAVSKGRPIGIVTKRDFLEPIAQMEEAERRLTIQFSVKDDVEIDEGQRSSIMDSYNSFVRRYGKTLEAGTLFAYMKTHGTNYRERQLIHCRLQLRTRKGSFFTSSEGWTVGGTFQTALERLERQILRSKELEYEPEFARRYLKRIRFPQTEL